MQNKLKTVKAREARLRREISKYFNTIKLQRKEIRKWKTKYERESEKNKDKNDHILDSVKKIERKGKLEVRKHL